MPNNILLEICCSSIDDAIEAERGGADRIELCSALFLGGLTPSIGTLDEARARLRIPIMSMVRPRSGGFCYTEAEFATMLRDAEAAVAHRAEGVVFGILNSDGTIDVERTRAMCKAIGGAQKVFHRAFDVTPDPLRALEQLIELGITRVLTSGQQPDVIQGHALIRKIIEQAAGRIEVLPGGGIPPHMLEDAIRWTGCSQVHLTAFRTVYDHSTERNPIITFGGALYPPENNFTMTDAEIVRGIRARVKG